MSQVYQVHVVANVLPLPVNLKELALGESLGHL